MATRTPTRLKVLSPPVRRTGIAIAAPQATGDVPQTPYLNLNLPPTGFPSWGPDLNQNFSAIDAAVGSLQRAYQGDWINNRVYAAGQIVIFEGGVFISLVSGNIGLQPDLHPESWGPMGSATSITYPPAGIAVSQGSAGWAPSINPATIPPYPNAGVPVSTSTAWAASIPVANIVLTNPTANTIIDYGWNTFRIQGSAPGAVAGNATTIPVNAYAQLQGPSGQATTGTTGQAASNGGIVTIAGGDGGIAPVGSTNGGGGTVFIGGGRAGQGAGAAGVGGDVYIQENWGTTYIGGGSAGGGRMRVFHNGVTDFFSNIGASGGNLTIGPTGGLTLAWNISNAVGETCFINCNSGAAGGFNWYNVPLGAVVGSTTPAAMWLDSSNALHVGSFVVAGGSSGLFAAGDETINVAASANAVTRLQLAVSGQAGRSYPGSFLITTYAFTADSNDQTIGIIHRATDIGQSGVIWSVTRRGMAVAGGCSVTGTVSCGQLLVGSMSLSFDGGSSFIDGAPSGRLLLNAHSDINAIVQITGQLSASGSCVISGNVTSGGGIFCNAPGNQLGLLTMDGGGGTFNGACVAQGFYTSGAKAFRIEHPLDPSKMLTHASLEGPELGVYYRGEAETVDGVVEIALPDYFEALTMSEWRTVQLTELYEEEDEPVFGNFLAASRVKEGKFRVRSSSPSQKFFWEVKAVRGDIGELIIEDTKENKDASSTRQKPTPQPITLPAA
jgi:hypothetical protein